MPADWARGPGVPSYQSGWRRFQKRVTTGTPWETAQVHSMRPPEPFHIYLLPFRAPLHVISWALGCRRDTHSTANLLTNMKLLYNTFWYRVPILDLGLSDLEEWPVAETGPMLAGMARTSSPLS